MGNKKRRREVNCQAYALVILFGGGVRGEQVFLTLLEGVINFWEEMIQRRYQSHFMVTRKGRFKGDIEGRWDMLTLVNTTNFVIDIRKLVGTKLYILVKGQSIVEVWVFQHENESGLRSTTWVKGFKMHYGKSKQKRRCWYRKERMCQNT